VSDSTSWASPGWTPDAGQSIPNPPPSPAAGWTPPPKPGLIPLRPLDFGTVFGASFQVLRRNPRPTFGAALLLNALVVFLSTSVSTVILVSGLERASRASLADATAITTGTIGLSLVAALITVAIALVAQALLTGIISLEVSRATVGEKLTLRELFAAGHGRWKALIGWTMLLGAIVVAAIAALIGLSIGFFAVGDPLAIAGGVILLVVGALGLLVVGAWVATMLAFVPAAIVLERLSIAAALRRSWQLVRGSFWRIFGIVLLLTVMVNVAVTIVTTPLQLVTTFATPLLNPAGELETDLTAFLALNIVVIGLTAVAGAIGAVLTTSAISLLYIDRRMRTEGLDLELQRFVELRASGAPAVDPYRTTAPSVGGSAGASAAGASAGGSAGGSAPAEPAAP